MLLRPYQAVALADIQNAYRSGKRAPLLCAPTGSGKSAMTAYMLDRTTKRTLYLCHRAELLESICDDLKKFGIAHSVISSGSPVLRHSHHISVGMMQTVARRLDNLPQFEWVISDEAHLAMAPTWMKILSRFKSAWHLGMSATPCRLDGKGLGEFYDQIIYGPSVRELTDRGYLSPCRAFAPMHQAVDIKKSGSDFSMEDAARLLDKAAVTGSAVDHLRKLGPDRRTIVFCCTREHAEHVADQFRTAGFAATNVDGSMLDRKQRIEAFKAGRVQVLTNVELLTTGYDDPSIGAGIFLRPTQSLALYLQMIGRILRIAPGKSDALLLDHVGNVIRHGMPDDTREWTLEGRAKRSSPPPVRQCPMCYAAFSPVPHCPSCGHVFAVKPAPTRGLQQRDGELTEVSGIEVQRLKREQLNTMMAGCSGLRDLQELAKRLGYKPQWAFMQWQHRRNRRKVAA